MRQKKAEDTRLRGLCSPEKTLSRSFLCKALRGPLWGPSGNQDQEWETRVLTLWIPGLRSGKPVPPPHS